LIERSFFPAAPRAASHAQGAGGPIESGHHDIVYIFFCGDPLSHYAAAENPDRFDITNIQDEPPCLFLSVPGPVSESDSLSENEQYIFSKYNKSIYIKKKSRAAG
jgi:hypothetical protein